MATKKELRQKLKELMDRWEKADQAGNNKHARQLSDQIKALESRIRALGAEEADDGLPPPPPLPEPPPLPTETPPPTDQGGGTPSTAGASALYEILAVYGIDPAVFSDLISQAIKEQWGGQTLVAKILQDPRFQEQFPGIETLITEYGAQSLSRYQQLASAYKGVLKDFGAEGMVSLDKRTIGWLIGGDTSAEEFALRVQGYQKYKANPQYGAYLEAQAKEAGMTLGIQGQIEFMGYADLANPELYDLIEGAEIMQYGSLDVTAARRLARAVGEPGQQGNIMALVETLADWDSQVMQEVRAAGITREQVVRAALEPQLTGEEKIKGAQDMLTVGQVLRNRQATLAARPESATSMNRQGRPVTQGYSTLESVG